MDLTFPERRVVVTRAGMIKTASEIYDIYPLLFSMDSIRQEFERLMEYDGLDRMMEGIEKLKDKLMPLKRSKGCDCVLTAVSYTHLTLQTKA